MLNMFLNCKVNASNGMNGGNGIGCEVLPYEEVYVAAAPGARLSNATPVSYYCVTTGDPSDTLARHSYYLPAAVHPHSTCGHQMPSGAMGAMGPMGNMGTLGSMNTMTMTMKRAGGAQGQAGQNQNQNPLSTFVSYRSGSIDGESLVNVDTNALDDATAESLTQPNGVALVCHPQILLERVISALNFSRTVLMRKSSGDIMRKEEEIMAGVMM